MKQKNDHGVFAAVRMAAASHRLLTVGTVLCVAASVAASLLPPLLLARVIDRLTVGLPLSFLAVLLYFGSLALEGVLTSAQESLLVLFGQRMTHALRSEMSRKLSRLPAGTLAEQNPGEVAARFSGDVDTVEALFTSGIISMAADACRIVSIMGVIAVKNTGLALILLLVPPLFAVVLVASFFLSSNCLYTYNANSSKTSRQNETQIAKEMIEEHFGAKNYAALVIPAGDYDREQALIDELLQCDEVESITSLSSIEAMDGYVLTDKLTPRQFSEMIDLDIDTTKLLYSVYAAENADYSKLITNMNDYSVPIIDMFMFVYDLKSDGYVQLDGELGDSIDDLYAKLNTAKKQLSGENYSRMLVYMNLPVEGDETYAFIDKVHTITAKYYDTSYFVGDSTSCYDLATSFATDNIIVSVLSVLFVILILFFTFKNAGLPVLLILVIQGSVWMNFSMSTITGASIFFLSYLIISSIQMGANIDYAIVISSRYMDLKKEMDIKSAMRSALNFAFPTVLTSGGIMASAGFLISKISTEPAIVSIGTTLCRGTLISMFLVMLVLPEILLLGDSIVEKTGVTIKKPELVRRETGNFVINGHVRGRIEGFVDADVNGAISGNLDAVVKINTFEGEKGDAGDEQKNPDAQA